MIQHLAVELGSESMLSINQPWTTGEDGYVTVVSGRLLDVRINSSLEYPLLAKAETVEVWGREECWLGTTVITHWKLIGRLSGPSTSTHTTNLKVSTHTTIKSFYPFK